MRIPLDPPIWNDSATIMASWEEAGYRRFALAGRSDIVSAQMSDGEIQLFPERSSGHRALATALGFLAPEAEG